MNKPLDHAAVPVVIIGSTEDVRDFLFGPQQHDEHCRGYRWHQYAQPDLDRMSNVWAELRSMWAERRARLAEVERV
jgi:hypothetical protein